MLLKPQFTFEELYVSPLTRQRGFDEEKLEVIYVPRDLKVTYTGVEILEDVRTVLRQYRHPRVLCRQWGIATVELHYLLRLLTGMDTNTLYMAWRQRQTDELLRYTNLSLQKIASTLRLQSTMALYRFVSGYSGQSPTARRRSLRQKGDVGRYAL